MFMDINYRFLAFCLITIFLLNISLTSAFEFDNVKSYDPITREVIIKNAFGLGADIGKARLNTPLNVKVGLGYQKVAEFDLWAYQDYNDILKSIDFYDKNNIDWSKHKFERDFDIKYKTYENIKVDDYKEICDEKKININGTSTCSLEKAGYHYEEKEVWKKINPADLKKNEFLTIGIFTDVQIGDYVEWIPSIYGVKINEWASWTADLNVDIVAYYKLDETSGDVLDATLNGNDGTNNGATRGVTGKINNAFTWTSTESDDVDMGTLGDFGSNLDNGVSISFWIKTTSGDRGMIIGGANSGANTRLILDVNNLEGAGIIGGNIRDEDGNNFDFYTTSDTGVTDGDFHFVVFTANPSGNVAQIYIDNSPVSMSNGSSTLSPDNFANFAQSVSLGAYNNADSKSLYYDGTLDEVGIWNRVLTTDEINTVWNDGNGLSYNQTGDSPPTIILNSPSSANYTSLQSLIINLTAFDDIELSDVKLYVNDVLNQTNASGINNTDYLFNLNLGDGDYTIYGKATDNESQTTDSDSIRIIIDTTPFIEFVDPTPVNYANWTETYIPLAVNVSTDYFKNISYNLYNINGTILTQNFDNETFSINFTDVPSAHYHYNVTICTTTNKCNSTETRHINHDVEAPLINLTSPLGIYNYLKNYQSLDLNWSVLDIGEAGLDSCWYNYYGIHGGLKDYSDILPVWFDGNLSSKGRPTTGNYTFKVIGALDTFDYTLHYNNIDLIEYETINISSCEEGEDNFKEINLSVTNTSGGSAKVFYNFSCGDNYFYNKSLALIGINLTSISEFLTNKTPVNCLENTTELYYLKDQNTLTFYANDTFGNENSTTVKWGYKIFGNSQTYNNITTEGNLDYFALNVTINESYTIDEVNLIYDDETKSVNVESTENPFILKKYLIIPSVSEDTNQTFYWSIGLTDSTIVNSTETNQTVLNIDIANCTTYTKNIYNFLLKDEELQTDINDGRIETAFNLYSIDKSELVLNFSQEFNDTNMAQICLNNNLTSISNYTLDVIVKYNSPTRATEYYNIINATLTNSTATQNITLYDLLSDDATDFQLTFTGADFLPVENALIYVERQYIAENIFKTVELPKTDYNGQAVLHLVRNDIIYNIRILDTEGNVLGNFDNLVAFCQDFTIGDCRIELNAFDSVESIFDYDEALGITFSYPTYNQTSGYLSFVFSSVDGNTKTVNMQVEKNDIFGNRSICNNSLSAASGIIKCSIDPNLDESVLVVNIYVDGDLVIYDKVNISDSDMGEAGYLVLFFLTLSFIFVFSNSKTGILLSIIISFGGAIGLSLIKSDLIGFGASGLWLLIIIIIALWKIHKDRGQ